MKSQNFIRTLGKLAITAAVMVLAPMAVSGAAFKSVILSKTDGSTVTIDLASNLETTVSTDGDLVFAKGGERVLAVPATQVAGWKFSENGTTSIKYAEAAPAASARVAGNRVVIDGLAAGTTVSVISAAGQTVLTRTADGACELRLDALTPGVYVIAYDNQTLKIAVR